MPFVALWSFWSLSRGSEGVRRSALADVRTLSKSRQVPGSAASAPGLMLRTALQPVVSAVASRRALIPFVRRCDLGHPRKPWLRREGSFGAVVCVVGAFHVCRCSTALCGREGMDPRGAGKRFTPF